MREARFLLQCLGVAGFAMMNIMLLSVSVWSGNISDITQEQRDFFTGSRRSSPCRRWPMRADLLPLGAHGIAARQLNMDVPISLGVLLAVGMSLVETAHHGTHAYFDSAVMLLFFCSRVAISSS